MPNYQPQPEEGFVKVTGIRICSTDGYTCVFFYDFEKQIVERDIRRRIILNGQTGSSWRFKRFNHFKIHVPSDKLKANRQYGIYCKYAKVDNGDDGDDNISFANDNAMVSLDDFIEDSFVEQSVSDYYNYPPLKNITK